ncbi:MAG: NADH-quinone oxidoreductase subunit C [Deltaproteobacteria bacterium]|nr:MAG: NADH-quinone oxidoreductase subunit C [Deltaproteobacteria bacterium]
MSSVVLSSLIEKFPEDILSHHDRLGNETAVVRRERIGEICAFLKEDPKLRMNMMMDLTVVDGLNLGWDPRFMVVYHLYSIPLRHRIRLKAPVPEEDPTIPSVVPVWRGAEWFEREAYDMYGIRFDGHPDLRRILLYPEFEGHPLRKDYPVTKRQPLVGPKN